MESAATASNQPPESLRSQVRSAVIWRSGSQIAGQLIQWASTFCVIRILDPRDYGLYAMTGVVLVLLNLLNGYGLASGLIQQAKIERRQVQQLFGLLILVNAALALLQLGLAPLAAAYYRHDIIAQMLRVQAILYLTTPFVALPYALLAREMDYRRQAWVNMLSSLAGAGAALGGALAGFGVWTLVFAPLVLFTTRAIGITIAARSLMWPIFDFRGIGHIARYGAIVTVGQLAWFFESQADVFIAGRNFSAHLLGIYTTSLFLTQIFVSKFVPPLNDVAFSAYARIQHDDRAVAGAFTRATQIIMFAALPFYFGLAATADPLVLTMLGDKWAQAAPVVRLLALAMPFMTMQVLLAPACDALGHPSVGVRNSVTGAVILSLAFLISVPWGPSGLAIGWIAAYPIFLGFSLRRALPVLRVRLRDLTDAIAPPLLAALVMALSVIFTDRLLPPLSPAPRLGVLVTSGALIYTAWLLAFARRQVKELIAIVRKRPLA
jgi:O-antigen/teichoic acid export membrane protein